MVPASVLAEPELGAEPPSQVESATSASPSQFRVIIERSIAKPTCDDAPVFLTRVLPWASVPVAGVVFIALLGGMHPSDAKRDLIVRIALALVVALQLPAVWALLRKKDLPFGQQLALLIVRLVISVPAILLAGSISHEAPAEAPATTQP